MKATGRTLALLIGALALSILGTLTLMFWDRVPAQQSHDSVYFYTNYDSGNDLVAASLENESGSVVLAQAGGNYYAVGDIDAEANREEIADFFVRSKFLPLTQLVEGAEASDSQYGLMDPAATVVLQDASENGVMFLLGNWTPDGNSLYTCLSGDERVFIMDREYAEPFFNNVDRFFDLTLYPSLQGDGVEKLTGIEIKRDGEIICRLQQLAVSDNGSTVWYRMEEPWNMLVGAEPIKTTLINPLREMKGISVLEGTPEQNNLGESSDGFRLEYKDGTKITVWVGSRSGELVSVAAEDSELTLLVPAGELSFMDMTAEEILNRRLLSLNINEIQSVTLGQHLYEIKDNSGDRRILCDGKNIDTAQFQNTIFTALNRISIGGEIEDGESVGNELLHIHIDTTLGEEIDLSFSQMEQRRCSVTINGQLAVWCDLAAVSTLLEAAG